MRLFGNLKTHLTARSSIVTVMMAALAVPSIAASQDIVLAGASSETRYGRWSIVTEAGASVGAAIRNPDAGAAKITTARSSPSDYFELSFNASAGTAYRLWIRGRAQNDYYTNDSVFVQFSNSVTSSGSAIYRIGTTSAAEVNLEDCSGCGISGWKWQDNGWGSGVLGPTIYFASSGAQNLRVQTREDGLTIDQIVLSPSNYLNRAPTSILGGSSTSSSSTTSSSIATNVVLNASSAGTRSGGWVIASDSGAAGGAVIRHPDAGAGKIVTALASPTHYFEMTFDAVAGAPYRLWLHGRAQSDYWGNDSVFVQFSNSVDASGNAVYRIGTTSATEVNLEDCKDCGLSGWKWQDNGWGSGVLGPRLYFASTGQVRMRVQTREDGLSIDQIILSPTTYLSSSPPATSASAPAPTAPAPAPEPAPTPAPTGSTLKVLEWNIHHGVGTDGVYDINRLATWMATMNPDVILLNEVEKYTSWGNEDQPARFKSMLQSKTGRTWYAHFSQEFGSWSSNGKGHLILSVYPFDSTSRTTITQSSGLKWAGAIGQATITVNGRRINLLLTHLDPYDQTMRLTQARDVLAWASSFAENKILSGDMNAWPDQSSILELYKYYRDSWVDAANLGTASAPSDISPYGATKNGRIDYILYSKGASNLVVRSSKVYDTRSGGVMPSDHRPVMTTFEVR